MARRYATISRSNDGALLVDFRYADAERGERSGHRLDPGESLEGVPFEQWATHVGQQVDLSTWHGTGEGMIGGPDRMRVAGILYDGPLTEPCLRAAFTEEIEAEIARWEAALVDDRYEYTPDVRRDIRRWIRDGRKELARRARAPR